MYTVYFVVVALSTVALSDYNAGSPLFHPLQYFLPRPSASELLKFQFFKKAKDKDFLKEVILGDTPSLQSRGRKVRIV